MTHQAEDNQADALHVPVLTDETMPSCGLTYPTGDGTASKPRLSWHWQYGNTRIPSSLSISRLELLARDD